MNNRKPYFLLLCVVLMIATLLLASCSQPHEFVGTLIEPPRPAPQAQGVNWDGTPFTFQDLEGKVALVFFGYTSCPDICPTTLGEFKRIKSMLTEDEQQNVAFVMVSVDPERDTVERLAQYVPAFDDSFYGVRFEEGLLEEVKKSYSIYSEKVDEKEATSQMGYLVDHTASTLVLNREGGFRLSLSYGTDVNTILPDIRQLLKE